MAHLQCLRGPLGCRGPQVGNRCCRCKAEEALHKGEEENTDLVQSWCEDRHEEPVVDVANQLVSDIRVGHLGTVTWRVNSAFRQKVAAIQHV